METVLKCVSLNTTHYVSTSSFSEISRSKKLINCVRICVYLWTHTPHNSREHEDNA